MIQRPLIRLACGQPPSPLRGEGLGNDGFRLAICFVTGRRMGFPTAPKGLQIKVLFGPFSFKKKDKKKNQDFFFSLVLLPCSSTR